MISCDTETNGLDTFHSAKPFFVTCCNDQGAEDSLKFWHWRVDPLTRQPVIPPGDLEEIRDVILMDGGPYVFQNAKFDMQALSTIGLWDLLDVQVVWGNLLDTLVAGHLLASNHPHGLTSMASDYLGINIKPWEDALQACCKEARHVVQQASLRVSRRAKRELEGLLDHSKSKPKGKGRKRKAKKGAANQPAQGTLFDLGEGEETGKLGKKAPEVDPRDQLACWKIAHDGLEGIPSAKAECWQYDMWLPRELAIALEYPESHIYHTALRDYSNKDSEVTILLIQTQLREIKRRGLEKIYANSLRLPEIIWDMECHGTTVNGAELRRIESEYQREVANHSAICCSIADDMGYGLNLPKGRKNGNLMEFCFGSEHNSKSLKTNPGDTHRVWLDLPIVKYTEAGFPSLDKHAVQDYTNILPPESRQGRFIKSLAAKGKRDTSLNFLASYQRFWLPFGDEMGRGIEPGDTPLWYVIHPSYNQTGTSTLRFTCNNPNGQQISRQETDCPACKGEGCLECDGSGKDLYSLRESFGPAPGREWWSCDAANIELRLPAYKAGEEEMIALFERPNDPPYFGSNHLLTAHVIFPGLFNNCLSCITCAKEIWVDGSVVRKDECCKCARPVKLVNGKVFKKRYEADHYRRTKNFNFAIAYRAVDRPDGQGTADQYIGISGAQSIVKQRFRKIEALDQYYVRFAEKHGYVETFPCKSIDPARGYPILCSRTEWGKIKPTVPLNYAIQSTAMQWTRNGMIASYDQLRIWQRRDGFDGYITLQVHDEIVYDFPKSNIHPTEAKEWEARTGKVCLDSNLWRIRKLRRLLESGGDDIGIPTPTSCEYHEKSWARGLSI